MNHLNTKAGIVLLAVVLLIPALSSAVAGERITIENGQISIENPDSDRLLVIDTDSLHELISTTLEETMDGMGDVLAELENLQLEIRLGEDNKLSVETEDQMWEMDLDLIFKEVGHALDTAFEGMETDGWSHHRYHESDDGEEDLAAELERLKSELNRLQKKLDHAKEI